MSERKMSRVIPVVGQRPTVSAMVINVGSSLTPQQLVPTGKVIHLPKMQSDVIPISVHQPITNSAQIRYLPLHPPTFDRTNPRVPIPQLQGRAPAVVHRRKSAAQRQHRPTGVAPDMVQHTSGQSPEKAPGDDLIQLETQEYPEKRHRILEESACGFDGAVFESPEMRRPTTNAATAEAEVQTDGKLAWADFDPELPCLRKFSKGRRFVEEDTKHLALEVFAYMKVRNVKRPRREASLATLVGNATLRKWIRGTEKKKNAPSEAVLEKRLNRLRSRVHGYLGQDLAEIGNPDSDNSDSTLESCSKAMNPENLGLGETLPPVKLEPIDESLP